MNGAWAGALAAAAACALAAPYLARVTGTPSGAARAHPWRGAAASSRRTLAVLAVGVVLGALAGAAAGWHPPLPAFVLLALGGTGLTVIDFEQHRLPNRLVGGVAIGAAVLLTAAAPATGWTPWVRSVEAAAAVFAALFVLAFALPRAFGLGDVKLGGVLGAYLGWYGWGYVYYGILAGFVLGALVGVALLAGRRATMKSAIAFGPMLLTGALLVLAFDLVPASLR